VQVSTEEIAKILEQRRAQEQEEPQEDASNQDEVSNEEEFWDQVLPAQVLPAADPAQVLPAAEVPVVQFFNPVPLEIINDSDKWGDMEEMMEFFWETKEFKCRWTCGILLHDASHVLKDLEFREEALEVLWRDGMNNLEVREWVNKKMKRWKGYKDYKGIEGYAWARKWIGSFNVAGVAAATPRVPLLQGGEESKFGDTGDTLPAVEPPVHVTTTMSNSINSITNSPISASDSDLDSENKVKVVEGDKCGGRHHWEECGKPGYTILKGRTCFGCRKPFRHDNDGIEGGKSVGYWPTESKPAFCCRVAGCVAMCAQCKRGNDVSSPLGKRKTRGGG
jgi:hypothetical protein